MAMSGYSHEPVGVLDCFDQALKTSPTLLESIHKKSLRLGSRHFVWQVFQEVSV
jgi:hypothetical protein